MKANNVQNQEALDLFYSAVKATVKNPIKTNQERTYKLWQDLNTQDVYGSQFDLMIQAFTDLPYSFYDIVAKTIVKDLNQWPFSWIIYHKYFYLLLSDEVSNYLNTKVIEFGFDTDAAIYYNAMEYIEYEEFEIAILYLKQLEYQDSLAHLLLANCYDEAETAQTAMLQFEQFIASVEKELQDIARRNPNQDVFFPEVFILKNTVEVRLTSIYSYLKYYKKAIQLGEKVCKNYELKHLAADLKDKNSISGLSDFEVFCSDYARSIAKINGPQKAAVFLDEALKHYYDSELIAKELIHYKERSTKHKEVDELTRKLIPARRAFGIENFGKSKRMAREKTLEDMIIEHIKYGFMTFGRKLELYNDGYFMGRQYILRDGSGRLDLLLIEKETDTIYVLELKRDLAGIEVHDQISRYVHSMRKETNKNVKGIICLHQPTVDLISLVKKDPEIELFTYHFDFKKLG